MDASEPGKTGVRVPIGDATVVLADVHMRYRVPSEDTAERAGMGRIRRLTNRIMGAKPEVVVRALTGVSLVARSGESIGIVGRNGSGKSTTLRIIAGLEPPSRGTVLAESTPVLLGVSAALHPELSGAQNVRLGLLALGKTPEDVVRLMPEVIDIAGIGKSIHLPMKTYSSGMGSRLRFAIAAAAKPDILLIDEALGTGDAAFSERSEQTMTELRRNAGTVFLVSHAAQTIEELCTRAIWLHQGRIVMDGPAEETARQYRWWSWNISKGEMDKADGLLRDAWNSNGVSKVSVVERATHPTQRPRHARR